MERELAIRLAIPSLKQAAADVRYRLRVFLHHLLDQYTRFDSLSPKPTPMAVKLSITIWEQRFTDLYVGCRRYLDTAHAVLIYHANTSAMAEFLPVYHDLCWLTSTIMRRAHQHDEIMALYDKIWNPQNAGNIPQLVEWYHEISVLKAMGVDDQI